MEQQPLPHMPELPEPTAPEPLWVDAFIEVRLHVKADIAGLVFRNRQKHTHYISSVTDEPLDYDDLTLEWLEEHHHSLASKGGVFLHNQLLEHMDVSCYFPELIEEVPLGESVEIDFPWTPQQQDDLDAKLDRK